MEKAFRRWRYRAELWKLPGKRDSHLRRECRRIEASLMRRHPCSTACGRPRQIGKAALRHGKIWERSKVKGRERGRRSGGTRFVASAAARTKPGPPFQEHSNPPEAVPNPVRRGEKPHGRDAGARGLHQCGGVLADGPHRGAALQFPNFGAVAPSPA
ncbi:MAG: hypothetical protein ILM98_03180 [Kiritimatiellae bacterium]|nr:hypothetical protein [Kiritimatiellia bacterium]